MTLDAGRLAAAGIVGPVKYVRRTFNVRDASGRQLCCLAPVYEFDAMFVEAIHAKGELIAELLNALADREPSEADVIGNVGSL